MDRLRVMTATEQESLTAKRGEPLVVLAGVQKHFGSLHALKDIELTVTRGEVVVVDEDFGLRISEIVTDAAAELGAAAS